MFIIDILWELISNICMCHTKKLLFSCAWYCDQYNTSNSQNLIIIL